MTASRISSRHLTLVPIALAVVGCSSAQTSASDGGYNFGDAPTVHHDSGPVQHDAQHDAEMAHDTGHPPSKDGGEDAHHSDAGGACNNVAASGAAVMATQASGTLPAAVGGTIAAGTYVLVERDYYSSDGQGASLDGGGTVVRRSLVFTASTLEVAETDGSDAGVSAPTNSTYEVVGELLSLKESCPTPNLVVDDLFSVVTPDGSAGSQLWLLMPDENIREIYVAQ
jgi:hypothetical protein